jgi:hypothetical protein
MQFDLVIVLVMQSEKFLSRIRQNGMKFGLLRKLVQITFPTLLPEYGKGHNESCQSWPKK